jgi:ABC-type polysaccharide/polyol phosphate export permease
VVFKTFLHKTTTHFICVVFVGIVLKGFSHHASQEAKESSIKLNSLLKVLNLQGNNDHRTNCFI